MRPSVTKPVETPNPVKAEQAKHQSTHRPPIVKYNLILISVSVQRADNRETETNPDLTRPSSQPQMTGLVTEGHIYVLNGMFNSAFMVIANITSMTEI